MLIAQLKSFLCCNIYHQIFIKECRIVEGSRSFQSLLSSRNIFEVQGDQDVQRFHFRLFGLCIVRYTVRPRYYICLAP